MKVQLDRPGRLRVEISLSTIPREGDDIHYGDNCFRVHKVVWFLRERKSDLEEYDGSDVTVRLVLR